LFFNFSIYITIRGNFNGVALRLEATFQAKKSIFKRYEASESFYINIYTLSPEELILEKTETYLKKYPRLIRRRVEKVLNKE